MRPPEPRSRPSNQFLFETQSLPSLSYFPQENSTLSRLKIARCALVTFHTVELSSYPGGSAVFRRNPFANDQGRVMPNVLIVAAFKSRSQMFLIINIESDNHPIHNTYSTGAPDSFHAFQPPAIDHTLVYPIF